MKRVATKAIAVVVLVMWMVNFMGSVVTEIVGQKMRCLVIVEVRGTHGENVATTGIIVGNPVLILQKNMAITLMHGNVKIVHGEGIVYVVLIHIEVGQTLYHNGVFKYKLLFISWLYL